MPTPDKATAADIYAHILEFCDLTERGAYGHWSQTSYKELFFEIFHQAYINGRCAPTGYTKHKQAEKRKKSAKVDGYVVNGERIKTFLGKNWSRSKMQKHKSMIEDLTAWWDAWTYAWSRYPNPMPRPYRRKPKPE
jgi:hypothetical protein